MEKAQSSKDLFKRYRYKRTISIKDIDINKIVSVGTSLVGYEDAKKIRPSCIFLPKMTAYRREFDGTKYMSFDKR